jgi:hypothetical protein
MTKARFYPDADIAQRNLSGPPALRDLVKFMVPDLKAPGAPHELEVVDTATTAVTAAGTCSAHVG